MDTLSENAGTTEVQTADFFLIDSTYEPADAQGVLLSIIQDKIEFLGFRIQGLKEKNASGTQYLERRVAELSMDRAQLLQFLKNAQKRGKRVKVNCNIHLELED